MSNINLLDLPLLKLVYGFLELRDKFELTLVNKIFHSIFYNSRLFDTVFELDYNYGYYRGTFLYKNVTNINVISSKVNNSYLLRFENLRDLNLSQMQSFTLEKLNTFMFRLPTTLLNITVKDENMKGLFKHPAINCTLFSITIATPKKQPLEDASRNETERETKPSFISEWYEKNYREIILHKTRIKYARAYPYKSIPEEVFRIFPQLKTTTYKAVINQIPFGRDTTTNLPVIEDVKRFKDLFMHSIILSQQCNWILITGIKIIYREKKENQC